MIENIPNRVRSFEIADELAEQKAVLMEGVSEILRYFIDKKDKDGIDMIREILTKAYAI